jgi:hypothetical protein
MFIYYIKKLSHYVKENNVQFEIYKVQNDLQNTIP